MTTRHDIAHDTAHDIVHDIAHAEFARIARHRRTTLTEARPDRTGRRVFLVGGLVFHAARRKASWRVTVTDGTTTAARTAASLWDAANWAVMDLARGLHASPRAASPTR